MAPELGEGVPAFGYRALLAFASAVSFVSIVITFLVWFPKEESRLLGVRVKVWFAAYRGAARMSTKNNLSIVSTNTPGPLYGIEFCSFTYVVGKLALQLLAPRWKRIEHRGRQLVSLTPNAYWNPAAILFWPHDGSLLSWPPPKYIGDDTIQAFIERFNDPVNLR